MSDALHPSIRVDFQNCDAAGRVRLNTAGSIDDLARHGVELSDGLPLRLLDGELSADGRAAWNESERAWVAEVHWPDVIASDARASC